MEYYPGNELYHLLSQVSTLNETQAKFYIAEIIIALAKMHSLGIVYRDLKPENIVFDLMGHAIIIDFGLSDWKFSNRVKICGTNCYMSPEVFRGETCNYSSDIYSLGAVLYEMLIGRVPYNHKDIPIIRSNYIAKKVKFSKNISKNAKNLIKGMLKKDPDKRLTLDEIINHSWFYNIDWEKIASKNGIPPFRPSIKKNFKYKENIFANLLEFSEDDT